MAEPQIPGQRRNLDAYTAMPAGLWEPPEAAAVPELRAQLVEHLALPGTRDLHAAMIAQGQSTLRPLLPPAEAAAVLLAEERARLSAAQLYFATADMTRLAVKAAETLPDFVLEAADLPAPGGFLVFAQPVGAYFGESNSGEHAPGIVPIVAVSWGESSMSQQLNQDGVWLTFWSALESPDELARQGMDSHSAQQFRNKVGPLMWDNEALWPFGQTADTTTREEREGTTAIWMQAVRAAWLLMQQPTVADATEIPRARAGRRRDMRAGLNADAVRLLHLRRATRDQGAPEGERAAREYTCRWMVSGHWRQHWYPKRGVHRPRWIAPYVKGPENKPLRTPETVHVWDR